MSDTPSSLITTSLLPERYRKEGCASLRRGRRLSDTLSSLITTSLLPDRYHQMGAPLQRTLSCPYLITHHHHSLARTLSPDERSLTTNTLLPVFDKTGCQKVPHDKKCLTTAHHQTGGYSKPGLGGFSMFYSDFLFLIYFFGIVKKKNFEKNIKLPLQ